MLAGALLATLPIIAAESPAYANVGYTFEPMQDSGIGSKVSILSRTIIAGDCRLMGTNQVPADQAEITLEASPQTGANTYALFWAGTAYTVSTIFGDVWNATFTFMDQNGSVIAQSPKIGSPLFRGDPVEFSGFDYVHLTPEQYNSISEVEWSGDC